MTLESGKCLRKIKIITFPVGIYIIEGSQNEIAVNNSANGLIY